MSRDSSGVYSLPLPDVETGTTIQSNWANTTMDDIAQAITDSLDRNGRGGMLSPFKFSDGVVSAPGAAWSNEPNSGIYRPNPGELRVCILGQDVLRFNDQLGAQIRNEANTDWTTVVSEEALAEVAVPPGSVDNQYPVWSTSANGGDGGYVLADPLTSDEISYDNTISGLTADLVKTAIDELDSGIESVDAAQTAALDSHAADTGLHIPHTGFVSMEVVASLPGTPDPNTLYFVTT